MREKRTKEAEIKGEREFVIRRGKVMEKKKNQGKKEDEKRNEVENKEEEENKVDIFGTPLVDRHQTYAKKVATPKSGSPNQVQRSPLGLGRGYTPRGRGGGGRGGMIR